VSVSPVSGSNNGTVTVSSTSANTGSSVRSATITISAAGAILQLVSITQQAGQSIVFTLPASVTYGDSPLQLTATASSGLPVSFFSNNSAVVTIEGTMLKVVGAGEAMIVAKQPGDLAFSSAPEIQRPIIVNRANQTITFATVAAKTFGDVPFSLTASSSNGLPLVYTCAHSSIATINGNIVTIKGAGSTIITASQSGNSNYNPAQIQRILTVNKKNQTITFPELMNRDIGNVSFSLQATSDAGLVVQLMHGSDKISLSGSQVLLLKPGRVVITASQSGNTNIHAATPVARSFCINPAKPLIEVSELNTESPLLKSNAAVGNQWYLNSAPITGATNDTYEVTAPGVYTVSVKIDDCESVFSDDIGLLITGNLEMKDNDFSIYPNPAFSELTIDLSGINKTTPVELTIYDLMGREIVRYNSEGGNIEILPIDQFNIGLFVIRAKYRNAVTQRLFTKE
jgi:hypothetical protein